VIAILSIAAFVAIFFLPLAPGLFELARPRDDRELPISLSYARDPRFFSRSFRGKIAKWIDSYICGKRRFLDRQNERADIGEILSVASRACPAEVQIARNRLTCGVGATITDGYGGRSVRCEDQVLARTLCSDGAIVLGEGCAVDRWIDAEQSLDVGNGCSLGMSASSGGTVTLAASVTFERVFGEIVLVRSVGTAQAPRADKGATVLHAREGLAGRDIVVRGDAIVPEGTVLDASVKTHGSLFVGPGARIAGNAVAREALVLLEGSVVDGHGFGEQRLFIGRNARIGVPGQRKTAYTGGTCLLCDGARVHGWVVSEQGGRSA
jgi:hypothetical protein